MGTTYHVKCWAPLTDTGPVGGLNADPTGLQSAIDTLLAQIDLQMSTYRDDSEISRFNQAAADEWFDVSPATAYVVRRALHYHRLTDGALDVTLGPVLHLWGFGSTRARQQATTQVPDAEALATALQQCGAEHLQARLTPPSLHKTLAALEIDLSALAKGFGVDAVGELLDERRLANWMVEIGGEVRARGDRPQGGPWRIGVENPERERRALSRVIPLDDAALATSGDYRNFRTIAGERYAHIVDPATGQPLRYRGISVSVVASTCMEADALATALLVMPSDAAYDWCEANDVAALFHLREDEGVEPQIRSTSRLDAIMDQDLQGD
jgi:thiamine biosynthesis lipoprotein